MSTLLRTAFAAALVLAVATPLLAAEVVGSKPAAAPAASDAKSGLGDEGWEQLSDEDGIRVWRKEIPGSDIIAFRGEGVIDASIAKVIAILDDTPRKVEWVAKAKSFRRVRTVSPFERVEHTVSGTPWPIKDRDFVIGSRVEFDREKRRVLVSFQSVEDPEAPETSDVRGILHPSQYVLEEADGGKKTKMRVEIHADPQGGIPKWLVNLVQKSWPRTTLEKLREQAAKPDIAEHPIVRDYFAGKVTPEIERMMALAKGAPPASTPLAAGSPASNDTIRLTAAGAAPAPKPSPSPAASAAAPAAK